jgi:negative regulator of sigma E activity
MKEELDSQLSAMFDDELAAGECELLARRLARDEQLKARWGRYAVIGAAVRAEGGVRLNAPLAGRVSRMILSEPAFAAGSSRHGARRGGLPWWQPVAGAAVAAGVAAVSIVWLRAQLPGTPGLIAQASPAAAHATPLVPVSNAADPGAGASYVVPHPAARAAIVPSTQLANYVVAHSVFSSPVARRNLLSAFMTSESGSSGAEEPPADDAQSNIR